MTPTQSRHFQKNCFECMWQDAAFGDFAMPAVPESARCHARADHAQEHSSWEADPRNAGKAMPAHLEKLLQQAQLTPKGTQPLAIPKRMAELFQMSFAPKAGPPDVALPPPPPPPPPAPPAPPQPTRHVSAAETSSAAKSSSTVKSLSAVANKMQAQPKKPTPPWHLKSVAALLPWHCLFNPVKDDPEIAFPCRQAPYCDALCQWCDWRRHKSLCLWYCLMFKVQEVVEFPEEIVIHICKFAEPEPDCEAAVSLPRRQQQPSQCARKKCKGTFNLSVQDGRSGSASF